MKSANKQGGFATLLVTMVLLFLGTLAVLSASKVVFFEQKTANNTYKHAQALTAARAGVDKTLSYLAKAKGTAPNKATFFDGNTKTLQAAAFPYKEMLGASKTGFSVTMSQPDATDKFLILIVSKGCSDGCAPCTSDCPASATVTQLVKFRSLVVNLPEDALLARGDVTVGGSAGVSNTSGVGAAIRAGGSVDSKSTNGPTVQNSPALANIPKDEYFQFFFSDTKAEVKASIPNFEQSFPAENIGGAFWVNGDTAIHGGVYGSPENPVVIIVDGNLKINAGTKVYGMLYVFGGLHGWELGGGGNADIVGAAISEGDFSLVGNMDIVKDAKVLGNISATTTPGKVIGSWKDF